VEKSIKYGKEGRLAPITCVVVPVCSPMDAMKDPNWVDRGLFTPVDDPVYGPVTVAQAQYKMTETPPRVKWVCRPVGYDNDFIYLKYLGLGPTRLKKLEQAGVV
jgi:crotonobetainyl-CoA:carnitine CoA-transferase CaiB-like acyl-CoA transferase